MLQNVVHIIYRVTEYYVLPSFFAMSSLFAQRNVGTLNIFKYTLIIVKTMNKNTGSGWSLLPEQMDFELGVL